jgi:hypothetical protein
MTMNAQYALDDYGMYGKRLVKFVLAQTSTTSSGQGSSTDPKILEREAECRKNSGDWNRALGIVNSGVSDFKCVVEGELRVGLSWLVGSYKYGKTYTKGWIVKGCQNSDGNCCMTIEQGMYLQ